MYSNQARDAYPNIPPQTEAGLVLGNFLPGTIPRVPTFPLKPITVRFGNGE